MKTIDYRSDEIDLLDLFRWMWQKKWIIFLAALSSILVGFIVIYLSKPLYEATLFIGPPSNKNISALNPDSARFMSGSPKPITTQYAYEAFTDELNAESNKLKFFKKQYFSDSSPQNAGNSYSIKKLRKYLNSLMITKDSTGNSSKYNVTVQSYSPKSAQLLLEQYIDFTNQEALNKIEALANENTQTLKRNLKQTIEMKQSVAAMERQDKINQLKEALFVAEKLDIKKPEQSINNREHLSFNLNSEPRRLYKLGTIALQAEITNLETRKVNDSFIKGLRELQFNYNLVKDFKPELNTVKMFNLNWSAQVSDSPVAPNNKFIILIFSLLGLTVGCMIVIVQFILKART